MSMIPTGNFGPILTKEERQRRMAQLMRAAGGASGAPPMQATAPPSGMQSGATAGMQVGPRPRMTAEQRAAMTADTTGLESQVERQRRMADQLRGGAPEGRTVGPSGIYVAPNIGDVLQNVGQNIMAGFADRRANKAAEELSGLRKSRAAAEIEYEDDVADWQEEVRREGVEYDRKLDAQQQKLAENEDWRATRRLAADIASRELQDALAQKDFDLAAEKHADYLRNTDREFALKEREYQQARAEFREEMEFKREELQNELDVARAEGETELQAAVNDQVVDMQKQITKAQIPRQSKAIEDFYEAIEPFAIRDEDGSITGYKNIPGLGGLMNPAKSSAALAQLSQALGGKDAARRIQQRFRTVINAAIKAQSGATVTYQEMQRELLARGISLFDNDAAALEGIASIERLMNEELDTIRGGYGDEVLSVYDERRAARDQNLTVDEYRELKALEEEEAAGG